MKYTTIHEQQADWADIQAWLCKHLDIVPKNARLLYKSWNGAYLPYSHLPPTSGGLVFLGARDDRFSLSVTSAPREVQELGLAVARDGTGNCLFMDLEGRIFFWDHDTGEYNLAFDSPQDMFRELREDIPEEPRLDVEYERMPEQERDRICGEAQMMERNRMTQYTAVVRRNLDVLKDVHARAGLLHPGTLYCAASHGDKDMVVWLLDHGVDVNAREPHEGRTPLHGAAQCGSMEVASLLIARGADVLALSNRGRTPSSLADLLDHYEVAEWLRQVEDGKGNRTR